MSTYLKEFLAACDSAQFPVPLDQFPAQAWTSGDDGLLHTRVIRDDGHPPVNLDGETATFAQLTRRMRVCPSCEAHWFGNGADTPQAEVPLHRYFRALKLLDGESSHSLSRARIRVTRLREYAEHADDKRALAWAQSRLEWHIAQSQCAQDFDLDLTAFKRRRLAARYLPRMVATAPGTGTIAHLAGRFELKRIAADHIQLALTPGLQAPEHAAEVRAGIQGARRDAVAFSEQLWSPGAPLRIVALGVPTEASEDGELLADDEYTAEFTEECRFGLGYDAGAHLSWLLAYTVLPAAFLEAMTYTVVDLGEASEETYENFGEFATENLGHGCTARAVRASHAAFSAAIL